VVPQVVAYPRHVDEMEPIVEISRATGVSLPTRGAGTSIAGNAVGPGMVVDFSRHLHRIREVDPESATAVVQPGVVLDDLQPAAGPHGCASDPTRRPTVVARSAG
jgi:FAD/FMN-containing dehydrogenase